MVILLCISFVGLKKIEANLPLSHELQGAQQKKITNISRYTYMLRFALLKHNEKHKPTHSL